MAFFEVLPTRRDTDLSCLTLLNCCDFEASSTSLDTTSRCLYGWAAPRRRPLPGEPLGFANIANPLSVKMEMLVENPIALPSELGIPIELPLSPALLLDNHSKEEEVWREGYPIMSESQKEQSDKNRRFLQAIGGVIEGENELSLALAPGFDKFPDGHFEKRQGPLQEHSHYQERLASLKWLIDISKGEVKNYSNALLHGESLPYPDLEDALKFSKQ